MYFLADFFAVVLASKWCLNAKKYDLLQLRWPRSGAPVLEVRVVWPRHGAPVKYDLLSLLWPRSGPSLLRRTVCCHLFWPKWSTICCRCFRLEVVPHGEEEVGFASFKRYDLLLLFWPRTPVLRNTTYCRCLGLEVRLYIVLK